MRAIERSKEWFESAARPRLERDFADVWPRLAVGMAGHGSECFGFDDELSHDHDFSIGFTIWLTQEDEAEYGFRLTRFYTQLQKDAPPEIFDAQESRLGETEYGVITIPRFFERHLGCPGVPRTWREWISPPDFAFAEALNGELFYDGPGTLTAIRRAMTDGMPTDVRLKKMAARAVTAAQSGQYNFPRCLKRGERGAAMLALGEFVKAAAALIALLNFRYACYYKWMLRGLRTLPILGDYADSLELLLTEPLDDASRIEVVELIAGGIIAELKKQHLSDAGGDYLETHAFSMRDRITSRELRALHILDG